MGSDGGRQISIHAPREGSDHPGVVGHPGVAISIHAPREGSDYAREPLDKKGMDISIHAPREGSDCTPARPQRLWRNFYPRSPRGERRSPSIPQKAAQSISIHAPREGSDLMYIHGVSFHSQISIHAPREGSDIAELTKYSA